jgi:DNA replication licensing factor MCM7
MRKKDFDQSKSSGGRGTITARQLLSILRLAEASAKLNLRQQVTPKDVDEAIRLISMSKASVAENVPDSRRGADAVSSIYNLVQGMARQRGGAVTMQDARTAVERAGYSEDQMSEFIKTYTDLMIIDVNASHTRIDFIGM